VSALSDGAFALVRGWTWLYTCRLPDEMRETRRLEIESDLWESRRDATGDPDARFAVQVLCRLILGIPDDVQWRFDMRDVSGRLHDTARTRALIAAAAGALLLAAAWAMTGTQGASVRADRADPRVFIAGSGSKPSPPPPPPSRPVVEPSRQ